MTRLTSLSLTLLVLSAALAVAPSGAPAQPATPPSADDDLTILHLSENAQRTLRQDRLIVELRAEATGGDPARVQATINRRMNAALDLVHAVPSIEVQTPAYWVQQERPPNAPPRWHGVQALTLSGSDASALLKLAGDLQQGGAGQQGGLIMSGLRFVLAPDTMRAAEDELTASALQRLRDRANRIAAEMKLEIRNYRDLRVGNVGGTAPPVRFGALSAAATPAPAPPVAEPGETTVQVHVDADVVLNPGSGRQP